MKKTLFTTFIVLTFVTKAQNILCFKSTMNYTDTILEPNSVTAADFNGDGNKDLAITNYGYGTATIMLGDNFGNFITDTSYAICNNAYTIVSSDFNIDGKTDLAVLNNGNNKIVVLLGNGAARFTVATTFSVEGNNPFSLIHGDFNLDNKPDLAWVNETDKQVAVSLGNGLGGFSPPSLNNVGNAPNGVTSADFNSDGKPDLAVANFSDSTISVLYGDGNGGFSNSNNFFVGSYPTRIIAGDFNSDGKIDLAATNYYSAKFAILLGNGAGGFSNPQYFSSGTSTYAIASADFNGDGVIDIVTTSSYNFYDKIITVSLGVGDGSFYSGTNFIVGRQPNSVIGVDLNNDGRGDIVVTGGYSDSVSVLLSCNSNGINLFSDKINNVECYPNPSNSIINVRSSDNIDEIKVINTLGQTVCETKPNSVETSIQLNEVGVYFICTTTNNNIKNTRKIIIMNK